ncbi:hypothetical protein CEE69_29855 [Rhodopirellula bahusiensis]|uniref:Uncharacterized protein n=1 Tax=Rhodopirellula bahusiensis TaxID=2014065 RepID=A0A2G1VY53_9BACT|nr:hypothetical protein CEE69_29855 [Rhodopirellula bahusiensis]
MSKSEALVHTCLHDPQCCALLKKSRSPKQFVNDKPLRLEVLCFSCGRYVVHSNDEAFCIGFPGVTVSDDSRVKTAATLTAFDEQPCHA